MRLLISLLMVFASLVACVEQEPEEGAEAADSVLDYDGDGTPDDKDDDMDGDGVIDLLDGEVFDNCLRCMSLNTCDLDKDGLGDPCDKDDDNDGYADDVDNCPRRANSLQEDADQDKVGTLCDVDDTDPQNTERIPWEECLQFADDQSCAEDKEEPAGM